MGRAKRNPSPTTDGVDGYRFAPPILRDRTWCSILNVMPEDDPTDEISLIEERLEELAQVSERCRKIILVSKAAIGGGAALLLVTKICPFGSPQGAPPRSLAPVVRGAGFLAVKFSTLRPAHGAPT